MAGVLAGCMVAALPVRAQDALLARSLAATCANCHGTDGRARGEMKVLAGMPAEKLVASLTDFRSGAMPSTIMQQIAKGYTEQQIRLMAAYFERQDPRR